MEVVLPFAFVLAVLIPVLFALPGVTADRERARSRAQLSDIDRKLDTILRHLGITVPPEDRPAVVRQLAAGRKIQAIKVYRKETGASLAEAKTAVERIARERNL